MPADLTIMGKVIGGGLPAAAVGGRSEVMRMLAPAGEVYQAGTLSGNPLAMAAGIATLELLDELAYVRLSAITARLADGLRAAADGGRGAGPGAEHHRPLERVLQRAPGRAPSRTRRAATWRRTPAWCRELLSRGVYPPPSQFEAWFPSLAHTEEQHRAHRSRPPRRRSPACRAGGGA